MDVVIPQSKLDDPNFAAYAAQKLKEIHPDLSDVFKDASPDEVVETLRRVEAPNSSREEWSKQLESQFGEPPKSHGISAGAIAAGVGVVGAGLLAGALHMKGKSFSKLADTAREGTERAIRTEPPVAGSRSDLALKPTTSEFKKETETLSSGGGLSQQAHIQANLPKGTGEIQPTTRAHQTFDPIVMNALRRQELDPDFLRDLDILGGGRSQAHKETIAKAASMPSITVEELSNWQAGKPVSAVDEARAGFTLTYWHTQLDKAFKADDPLAAEQAANMIMKISPGWHNLTAEPGRALEFQKVFAMADEVTSKIAGLRAAGAPSDVVQRELADLLDAQQRELRNKKFTKVAMKLVNSVEDYATRAKLTSPVTHAVNTISNMLNFTQRGFERVATGIQAGMQGDPALRDAYLKYAFGTGQSFKDAARKSLSDLLNPLKPMSEKAELRAMKLGENTRSKYPLPIRLLNPYRWLAVADNFWKSVIIDSEMYTKAYTQARREGLTGEALAEKIQDLIHNPEVRDLWYQGANNVAKEYTFQTDPDAMLKVFQAFQRVPFGRLILPFVQTPYNIMTFYRRRSPFGLISTKLVKDWNAGGLRKMEAISRLGVGMGITGAAWLTFHNGEVTGPYPSNKKERDQWIAEGKRPWSMKIGKYWFQYSRFQPVGAYLMSVAALDKAFTESNFEATNKTQSKLGRALNAFFKGPLDLPLLQGLSTFFDVLQDPERNVKRFEQLVATGFIPNFLRDVTIQLDPTQRRPTNVKEAIEAMIPGLSQKVPARLDVFGNELQWAPGSLARGSKLLTKSSATDKTQLMSDLAWAPPIPSTKLSQGGEEFELTGELKQQFLKEMGAASSQVMDMFMEVPDFDTWPAEEKRKQLRNKTKAFQQRIRDRYEALVGLRGEAAQEEAKAMMGQQ